MKTGFRRILSGATAVILALSLSVSAFAATSVSDFTDEDYLTIGSNDYYTMRDYSINGTGVAWEDDAQVIFGESPQYSGSPGWGEGIWQIHPNCDKSVTELKLPSSVVILGNMAFSDRTEITSVNFEELTNLKLIDTCAFSRVGIRTADLSNTQVVRIGVGAFDGAIYKTFKTFVAPSTLKKIDSEAFIYQSSLSTITLNEGLETIGDRAFFGCSMLRLMVIPSTVKEIGENALPSDAYYRVYEGSYGEEWCKSVGATYRYVLSEGSTEPTTPNTPTEPEEEQPAGNEIPAAPNQSKVLVNGKEINFEAYTIKGNNYFKLRDVAYALNGTEKQFEVVWNGLKNAIELLSSKPYTVVGSELARGDGTAKQATACTSTIYKDGVVASLNAYTIAGNNYFKLRDLGEAFDFDVTWDGVNKAILIDTTRGYTAD